MKNLSLGKIHQVQGSAILANDGSTLVLLEICSFVYQFHQTNGLSSYVTFYVDKTRKSIWAYGCTIGIVKQKIRGWLPLMPQIFLFGVISLLTIVGLKKKIHVFGFCYQIFLISMFFSIWLL